MDQGLFKKYTLQIQKNVTLKEEILMYIQEKVFIVLEQEEITVSKKIITIQTSSVKRSLLLQRNVKEKLLEKGYSVRI